MTQGVRNSAKYEHGTENCYVNNRCRRPECRKASSRARKIRRLQTKDQAVPKRVPSIGSFRRLQALMRMGWSLPRLEREAGVREWYYRELLFQQMATLDRDRAEGISRLYEELCDGTPPCQNRFERQSVSHLKGIAARAGYLPPEAWYGLDMDDPDAVPRVNAEEDIFDWVKVERVLAGRGDAKALTDEEKLTAARVLVNRGMTVNAAAKSLHMAAPTLRQRLADDQSYAEAA